LYASEKETERVQNLRVEFWLKMQAILPENLVFIDEAGVNLSLTRKNSRARKGKRAYGKRPQKRSKNVSLIGAIGLKGVISQYSILGATDGLTFEAFIAFPKLLRYV
jgi:DDE superfamily endonuclease